MSRLNIKGSDEYDEKTIEPLDVEEKEEGDKKFCFVKVALRGADGHESAVLKMHKTEEGKPTLEDFKYDVSIKEAKNSM